MRSYIGRTLKMASVLALVAGSAQAEDVEVLHWWTSGGEAAALNVLKDDLQKEGIGWKDMPVAGGGGQSAMTVLRARVTSGDPPTAVQMLGFDISDWAQQGALADLDKVAADGNWDAVVPAALQKFSKYDGHWVAVPVNVHSTNWVWSNKKMLADLGIEEPKTWDEFIAAMQKVKDSGKIALAAGGQPWQEATMFDGVVLSVGGPEFYKKAFVDLDPEALGLEAAVHLAFAVPAGGLGERLGYGGIKVELPAETTSGASFLQTYMAALGAMQEFGDKGKAVPLVIMTSEDTHEKTTALLEEANYYGLDRGQVHFIKQANVPALTDNAGAFAMAGDFAIATKPHGHGDVHTLLHTSGLLPKFAKQGCKYLAFFQDTNVLAFKAIPAALGVSERLGLGRTGGPAHLDARLLLLPLPHEAPERSVLLRHASRGLRALPGERRLRGVRLLEGLRSAEAQAIRLRLLPSRPVRAAHVDLFLPHPDYHARVVPLRAA
ncbi:UTP--glucose-1-phosphate uridylyltransferase, partial [Thioclava electrotropha]|uniref:UTP--glucose-1-phosphate uridylyltransferase n=1 Tax=Thioclava electrotropha TaxID=1549850 RepID=UPI0023A84CBF